jgi:hypothetical protein
VVPSLGTNAHDFCLTLVNVAHEAIEVFFVIRHVVAM